MRTEMNVSSPENGSLLISRQRSWSRTQRSKRGGYIQHHERECARQIIEPNDHECYNSFGARFVQQEDNTEYPTTFHPPYSLTWVKSNNARPNENSLGLGEYTAEDVAMNEPLLQSNYPPRARRHGDSPSQSHSNYHRVVEVVMDRSYCPRSNVPQRKCSGSQSYSSFQGGSTKRKSCYDEARHTRNFKRESQYHAKRWEDTKEHGLHCSKSSPNMQSRFTPKRPAFKSPKTNSIMFGGQSGKHVKHTINYKSEEPSYNSKGSPSVPGLEIVKSAKISKMKCSKDNGEAESANKLATISSKENAEAKPTKKLATKPPRGNAEDDLTQKLASGSSKDNAEANGAKKNAETKSLVSDLKDASSCYIKLMKGGKIICHTKCKNPPIQPSSSWNLDIVKRTTVKNLHDLPQFLLFLASENSHQKFEWIKFFTYLYNYNKVAVVEFDKLKIFVFPPESTLSSKTADGLNFAHAVVAYELLELCDTSVYQRPETSVKEFPQLQSIPPDACMKHAPAFESDAHVKGSNSAEKATCSSISKCQEAVNSLHPYFSKEDVSAERTFVRADPSYLKTLGQAHSGWIFGAIAELVDNSRDARATRLEIAIETIHDKALNCEIPMLSIIDDGVGMNHQEILRMISFGHKQPDEDNVERIGRFGVGFKTGSMRLGRDALVLTQTTHSHSVAFLSQSLNEGKDNVEIPVVSYRRQGQCMEIDTSVQSEALTKYNLNAMKDFSPFNEYLIGAKAGLFGGNTGTQIYIWNLDKWGSDYTLEWQSGMRSGSSFYQGDIYIRSRRVRTRPGQTSQKVHIDYSLRSYLEVFFLEPRMKIFVQSSLVKSRPLAKSLNNTAVFSDKIMGRQVQLTIGRCQLEWDEANCGIFLYWHGRLIEAYKRVGGMIHSADMGRGVIGVIDVTELMDDGNGGAWVHSNKQGFQDCEPYAALEEWLGKKADEYWDAYFDPVQLKKGNARYKPDNEWVQCDKCRKWRMLNASFDSKNLPKDWFCYMEPFNGRCEMPEQKPGRGVITVGLKRSSHDPSIAADCKDAQIDNYGPVADGIDQEDLIPPAKNDIGHPVLKRRRRGPPRIARKYLHALE